MKLKSFFENNENEEILRKERKKYLNLQHDVEEYFEDLGYKLECKLNNGKVKYDIFLIVPIDFGYWKTSFDIIQTSDDWFGSYQDQTFNQISNFKQTISELLTKTIVCLCTEEKFAFEKSLLLHLFGTQGNHKRCDFYVSEITTIFKASLRSAKLKIIESHKKLPFGYTSIICNSANNAFTVYEE